MTAQPSWTNLDVINYRFLTTETNLKALYICCFFTQPYQLILKPILKMKTFFKKELHFENENSFWNSFWKWKFWKWKLIPKPILEMKDFANEDTFRKRTTFCKWNLIPKPALKMKTFWKWKQISKKKTFWKWKLISKPILKMNSVKSWWPEWC